MNAILMPNVQHQWLASSWTICRWSQPFEPNSSASFQASSLYCPFIWFVLYKFVCEDVGGDCSESLAKIKINNIYCSPLFHWSSSVIKEGCQVGEAWFPLCKSMLTTHNHFPVLNTGSRFQICYLLHHLYGDGGEAVTGWWFPGFWFCPSWRQQWHLLSLSPQLSPPVVMTFTT